MLPAPLLVRAIHRHWAQEQSTPTVYPGTRLDTADLSAWCELWVDAWSDAPRRSIAPDRLTVSIIVHCFSRDPVSKFSVHALADTARLALSGRRLPIQDDAPPAPQTLGWLVIQEHTLHDLTRLHTSQSHDPLQHLVLTFQAQASGA